MEKIKVTKPSASYLGDIPYVYWNVDGIGDMLGDHDTLEYLRKFKIIVLAETKKGPKYDPNIPGYKAFHHPRKYKDPKSKRYDGGILTLIADELMPYINVEPALEHLVWISVRKKTSHCFYLYAPSRQIISLPATA